MPKKRRGTLTPRQRAFVNEYIRQYKEGRTPNLANCAVVAGYSRRSASQRAGETMRVPEVRAAIQEFEDGIVKEIQRRFAIDAQTAVKTVVEIMRNPDAAPRDRLNAAKDILDRGGYKPDLNAVLSTRDGAPLEIHFSGDLEDWSK